MFICKECGEEVLEVHGCEECGLAVCGFCLTGMWDREKNKATNVCGPCVLVVSKKREDNGTKV